MAGSSRSSYQSSVGHSHNPLAVVWDLFVEFSQKSTIHGINYFGDRKRHWIERAWWMIAFVLSVCLCAWLIQHMYAKWDRNPIIISFAPEPSFVWEVPFPAITICPETKTEIDKFNFTKNYNENENPDHATSQKMDTLLQLCNHELSSLYNRHIEANSTNTIINNIKNLAPSLDKTMFFCRWGETWFKCSENIQTILTDEGQCFAFNMFNSRDLFEPEISDDFISSQLQYRLPQWTPEGRFNESFLNFTYPYRTFLSGYLSEFVAIMRLYLEDIDYMCRAPFQGYKLFLHPPHEIPNFSRHFQNVRVPLDAAVVLSVTPQMVITSEGLRDYDPIRRQCYYNSERKLKFFKFYTQSNCELECLANFTLRYCGCVQFSMPRNSSTPICTARKATCYEESTRIANKETALPPVDTEGVNISITNCNCMPACISISYTTEKFAMDFDYKHTFDTFGTQFNITDQPGTLKASRFSVSYQKNSFVPSYRSELYGRTEFMANCGGVVGLFMGLSILSFVEILYFCTIRIWFKLRSRQRRNSIVPVESKDAFVSSVDCLSPMKSGQSKR